jgi:hypothetical protein
MLLLDAGGTMGRLWVMLLFKMLNLIGMAMLLLMMCLHCLISILEGERS